MGLKIRFRLCLPYIEDIRDGLKSDQDGIENLKLSYLVSETPTSLVKIRPRWDWKSIFAISQMLLHHTVKIRPRWDWKIYSQFNRKDCHDELKSDQDGIENSPRAVAPLGCSRLKSDQDGIENRRRRDLLRKENHNVKIRPRWDWKHAKHWKYGVPGALKSDQDGIENEFSPDFNLYIVLR